MSDSVNHDRRAKWQFWIDRGGTFTDIVALDPSGTVSTHKLLSENPNRYFDAAIQGIKDVLGVNAEARLPIDEIEAVKMGTTVATNALLERHGADTLLVTTSGFKDQLRIGYQTRPDLFKLNIELPTPLYCDVLEVDERTSPHGKILVPLNEDAAEEGLRLYFESGLRSVAIVLMHAYRYHRHEERLAGIARRIGFTQISVSHEVCPLMKFVSRGDTTVVDAYLSPVLRRYVNGVVGELEGLRERGGRLMFMQSNGGLTDARFFQGKDAVLSGPAGGVVGMVRVCQQAGIDKVIGFDMGGTSTDACLYDGKFEKTLDTLIAGVRLRAPMMAIHTVAAGGGSVLSFDGSRYRVGPESAGAYPGPACYRNGGPLTITDCNVMLGRLQPDFFPAVFGPNGNQGVDRKLVARRFRELAARIEEKTGVRVTAEEVADGFLAIAVENMGNAIKKISVQRGHDVSSYTLCCFGGAGGQHACLVADTLGMTRIIVHPLAGVLSAFGMGLADTIVHRQETVALSLCAETLASLSTTFDRLIRDGTEEMLCQGNDCTNLSTNQILRVRYEGSDTVLDVPNGTLTVVVAEFERLHRGRFGFVSVDKPMLIDSVLVEVVSATERPIVTTGRRGAVNGKIVERDGYFDGRWQAIPFYCRDSIHSNFSVVGPAVIVETTSTVVVELGWRAFLKGENLILERHEERAAVSASATHVNPVMLEIFNNLFMSVAEQMGGVLENTAVSVNMKERLDFSCAVFDVAGNLIANAPHVPVHLGSMSESIKVIIRANGNNMRAGDAFMLNAPYNGGTHLPDVTVVKPVFSPTQQLLYFVAARGHHADIGGTAPGSAPAFSRSIEDEGVVIDNFKLVDRNCFRERDIRQLLRSGPWPARNPDVNIADLKAQVAACEKGAQELMSIVGCYGEETVTAYMQHVQDFAEECVRRILTSVKDGSFCYPMDGGYQVAVQIIVDHQQRSAIIDFTGTSSQHPGNFNAPTSVVTAAVIYVLRCLVQDNIPLNDGCLRPVKLIIPAPSMINPDYPGAVFAGNVETSQCIVDALFGALGAVAASQGTMNNFAWGNETYQYYETICGGAGATAEKDGASAVQTHMTNSKITDPEVLEWRYPVILESFTIRPGSGGAGLHSGGDGVIRRVRFLEPMTANIISGHRSVPPYGIYGGQNGQVGLNSVEHPNFSKTELPGVATIELHAGDVVVIETPGGGGYGSP